jgi:hypothetical protein
VEQLDNIEEIKGAKEKKTRERAFNNFRGKADRLFVNSLGNKSQVKLTRK